VSDTAAMTSALTIELARLAVGDACEKKHDRFGVCRCGACRFWIRFGERLQSRGFVVGSAAERAWQQVRGDIEEAEREADEQRKVMRDLWGKM
jgi:hypothetical protein